MSYLHTPRLVFNGDFLSDVSTVNNDTAHYNNQTFIPDFQKPGQGSTNGWWNPEGGAIFDFRNCSVRYISFPDGRSTADSASDFAVGQLVRGSEGRPTGKMVDIDPDAQMYSALWCVQIAIRTHDNELLFQGDLETTSFRDIQMRQTDGARNNGQALGATWTSVLKNVTWGEMAAKSPFLRLLRNTTQENKLSVNMNAFGYYYAHNDGRFSMGRILGSIGPYFSNEPITFAPTRRMYGVYIPSGQRSTYFSTCNFLVEQEARRVTVDLGACLPISNSMGTLNLGQPLYLAIARSPLSFAASPGNPTYYLPVQELTGIGEIKYADGNDWLSVTGGIVSIDQISTEKMRLLENHQLVLVTPAGNDQYLVLAREAVDGLVARVDDFVLRLDCNEFRSVKVHAYQWGQPLAGAKITITMQLPTPDTPLGPNNPISVIYGNNFPQKGLTYNSVVQTGPDGTAEINIKGNPIHSPRHYIDGQIYMFDYQLDTVDQAFGTENIVVHLRDQFDVIPNPVWEDIEPIMTQYGNLYPIMSRFLYSFSDPKVLIEKKNIFIFAFTRPIDDTMHMPVTRDLSEGKRQTILNWFNNPQVSSDKKSISSLLDSQHINPISPDTPLTDNQQKYKEAVKAKNGSLPEFPSIKNLFEN